MTRHFISEDGSVLKTVVFAHDQKQLAEASHYHYAYSTVDEDIYGSSRGRQVDWLTRNLKFPGEPLQCYMCLRHDFQLKMHQNCL